MFSAIRERNLYRLNAMHRLLNKTEVMKSGCVEFRGSRDKDGYGMMVYDGGLAKAHRVSYILANNIEMPHQSVFVCHSCDNPSCVNPEHLWLGSVTDNNRDKGIKGRGNIKGKNGKFVGGYNGKF